MNLPKKKSVRELSKEVSRTEVIAVPKVSKLKTLLLRLIGIKLRKPKYSVGDLLKRKTSDNPRELYEVRANLFDSNLDQVMTAHDMSTNKLVTIYELDFNSFTLFQGVVPGTMVNPNDI